MPKEELKSLRPADEYAWGENTKYIKNCVQVTKFGWVLFQIKLPSETLINLLIISIRELIANT